MSGFSTRDLLVELFLTVPIRLTHLLPILHHLIQPLVFALKGNPELVSQGLWTLELCIASLALWSETSMASRDPMEELRAQRGPGDHHEVSQGYLQQSNTPG